MPLLGACRTNNEVKTLEEWSSFLASVSFTNTRVEVGMEDHDLEDKVMMWVFLSLHNLYVFIILS